MIFGIGTDIVQVSRLEEALSRYGQRFAGRILAPSELERFNRYARPANFLAKRFAAKEATAKAFGTGFRGGLSMRHIIVDNDDHGRPSLQFVEMANTLFERFNISASHLSLTDENDYAVAMVVLETR